MDAMNDVFDTNGLVESVENAGFAARFPPLPQALRLAGQWGQ